MRIGIDARFYSVAGPGRYMKNLINSLEKLDKKNEYLIFLRRENFEKYQPRDLKFQKVLADYPWYSFKEQLFMPFVIAKARVDLMHFPHFNIPLLHFGPFVLTIHDLIMHSFSTQRATTRSYPYYRFKRLVYRFVFWWAIRKAKKILVPSEATRVDLINVFPATEIEKKIVVTYEGVGEKFKIGQRRKTYRLEKYGICRPYIFYLGSMYPHKNVGSLLKAFKILKEKADFKSQLVLVGKKDYFSKRLKKDSERLGLGKSVIFPGLIHEEGYIPDEEIVELFVNCEIFIFPSLKEGFGLPLLEAMSLKSPIAASDIPAVREICQEACVYFSPKNSRDMAEKILRIFEDKKLRQRLVSEGLKRVEEFSWEKMAKETLEIYENCFSSR